MGKDAHIKDNTTYYRIMKMLSLGVWNEYDQPVSHIMGKIILGEEV